MSEKSSTSALVVGRIVWKSGDLFKGQPQTEYGTKIPKMGKDGKQSVQFGFGLAVPKLAPNGQPNPELADVMSKIQLQVQTIYKGPVPPAFAYKYKDGDTAIDEKGILYNQREGYAGHVVFAMTTQLKPVAFVMWGMLPSGVEGNVGVESGIKCGDYVRVQVELKAHPAIGAGKPGMYINPMYAQFIASGNEIVSQVQQSADEVFGAPPQMQFGAPQQQQVYQQAPMVPPVPQQSQPYYNVLPPQHQPSPMVPPVPQQSTGFGYAPPVTAQTPMMPPGFPRQS